MKPLQGIRVVDLTHALAGPVCTYQLSLLGANVIKIENPAGGDDFRAFARTLFDAINAGKRSATLDLKQPEALEVLQRLVGQSDVLVDNFKPGTADTMGITWDRLRNWNKQLIWCSISGFGIEGPLRDLPAVEWSVQAASGLTDSYLGEEADPTHTGLGVLDIGSGQSATTAILAALLLRARTGVGQRIDVAMIDVALNLMGPRIAAGGAAVVAQRPTVGRFKARDRMLFIMGAHQRWFEGLSDVLGPPALKDDPRFADPASRIAHAEVLRETIERRLAARPAAEWEGLLTRAGIPASVVRRADEFTASDHVRQRGLLSSVTVADRATTIDVVGPPYRLLDATLVPQGPVPRLGADTDAVLSELHYTAADIAHLRARRLI